MRIVGALCAGGGEASGCSTTTSNCASGNGSASATAVLKWYVDSGLGGLRDSPARSSLGTRRCRTPSALPQPVLWRQSPDFRFRTPYRARIRRPRGAPSQSVARGTRDRSDGSAARRAGRSARPNAERGPVVAGAVSGDEIIAQVSVDLDRTAVKNTQSRQVRNRTSGRNRPETPDRRVQKTKASLHDALIGLAREKPYPSIAVKEILDRANVGRSTFYTHFRDKDDLLESGIHEILRVDSKSASRRQPRRGGRVQPSAPEAHRRASSCRRSEDEARRALIMHEHMEDVLTNLIADELGTTSPEQVESADSDGPRRAACRIDVRPRVELVGRERLAADAGGG